MSNNSCRSPSLPVRYEEGLLKFRTHQYAEAFLMRDSRVGFIRKVYLSLACQLLFTAGAVVLTTQRKAELLPWLLAGERQGRLGAVMYGGMAIAISSLLALQVKAFKGFGPTLALLTLFTVGESMMVSIITLFFKARSVYMGLIQTAVATLGLSLYAFQTNPKYDLTGVGQALASGLLVLLMFGILRIAFPGTFGGTDLLYSSFGAGLFSLFIVYDTQRVIGGKHRQVDQVDRKDWALGSVALYTDVLQLFIHLLHIFGSREQ
ncbi:inhibitor of apoptosis-promoting Bax1-domain-containing protein [Tribonema minus]|uniref:Inhibitor of apoptosis-promoting Bax1-domain-containing protein n=1 Tax=Tribonema minus TaxID=303371 RepID=A0A836CDW9_9STRA|nr:inhibitor of apoptosis-promoting Bax1-domain-containing protein [Tribonema minus]